jgi:hypothetical protein
MTLPRLRLIVAMTAVCVTAVCAVGKLAGVTVVQEPSPAAAPLDFQTYRNRVEPIFLKKRGDHARCYTCHSHNESLFHLQPLLPGQTAWTEEQSRLNLESVMELVTPGDISKSRILLHPLAPESGGEAFHSGGRQFESKDDPDWKTIADWVRAGKAGS